MVGIQKSTAVAKKISGQSLIGVMRVRAPVTTDTPAIMINATADARYTIVGANSSDGEKVWTTATRSPKKTSRMPSMSHSIRRMRLLSLVIGPNPSTIRFVGIVRCASPHIVMMTDPAYSMAELIIY